MRSLWEGQKGLRVKGGPGPALRFPFQGGQSGEGAGSLQPSILSGRKEKSDCVFYVSPHALALSSIVPPRPHTFCSGQRCGSSRISLCAFRLGVRGGARTARVGARSRNPRPGCPGEECCSNWWCLSTWGHSLGQGKKLSHVPQRPCLFQDPASLTPTATLAQTLSSSLAGQFLQGLGSP